MQDLKYTLSVYIPKYILYEYQFMLVILWQETLP